MIFTFRPLKSLKGLFGYKSRAPVETREPKRSLAGADGTTFKDMWTLASDRLGIYKEVDEMDQDDVCSGALDLLAEDAAQVDLHTNRTLWVESENEDIQNIGQRLLDNIEAEDNVFPIVREVCKYGDSFSEIIQSIGVNDVPGNIVRLCAVAPQNIHRFDDEHARLRGFTIGIDPTKVNDDSISLPWEYLHFRLLGKDRISSYGTSILAPARRVYRRLKMMEDALAIYRIKRTPDRLVFKIRGLDGLSPEDRYRIFNEFRQMLRKKMYHDPATGMVKSEIDPMNVDEDFFVDEEALSIEKLPGSQTVGHVLDVEYMRKRFFGCLKIPPDYLGFSEAKGGFVGQSPLSYQDVQFARGVKRIQRATLIGFTRLLQIELCWAGIDPLDPSNDFKMMMVPVSFLDELQVAELLQLKAKILGILQEIAKSLSIDYQTFIPYAVDFAKLPVGLKRLVQSGGEEVPTSGEVDIVESHAEKILDAVPEIRAGIKEALSDIKLESSMKSSQLKTSIKELPEIKKPD